MSRVHIEIIGPHPLQGTAAFTRFPVRLGRSRDCDLAFDTELDRATSLEHATIHYSYGGFILTDLGSTNGTFVNGSPVTTTILKDGDRIELGHGGPHLRVHLEVEAFESEMTAKTMVATVDQPPLELVLKAGGWGTVPLKKNFCQRVVTLGREEDNDVSFAQPPHPVVSRYHAEIVFQGGEYRLVDKTATNGTFLNGKKIDQAGLHDRDRITLGLGGPVLAVVMPKDPSRPRLSRARLAGIIILLLAISVASVWLKPPRQTRQAPGVPDDFTEAEFVEQAVRNFARALNSDVRVLPPRVVPDVEAHIATLVVDQREFFLEKLRRAQKLMPTVQEVLRENGLPPLLAYIAFQESRFDPHAQSRAGAVGLWQFMAATGREYGLRIDRTIDERLDPIKSTAAAARYLKKLYLLYGDFTLAMAAYNYGRENVNEALIRIIEDDPLHNRNYWYLVEKEWLPRETAEYVHKIIAGWVVASNLEHYGFPSELAVDSLEGTADASA